MGRFFLFPIQILKTAVNFRSGFRCSIRVRSYAISDARPVVSKADTRHPQHRCYFIHYTSCTTCPFPIAGSAVHRCTTVHPCTLLIFRELQPRTTTRDSPLVPQLNMSTITATGDLWGWACEENGRSDVFGDVVDLSAACAERQTTTTTKSDSSDSLRPTGVSTGVENLPTTVDLGGDTSGSSGLDLEIGVASLVMGLWMVGWIGGGLFPFLRKLRD